MNRVRNFLFLVLFTFLTPFSALYSCDDGSASITNIIDNGDGTYTVTYDVCTEYYGLEGNPYGWSFNYNNPNTIEVLSFSPPNIVSGGGDNHVGAIYDGNCDANADAVFGACDGTNNVMQYYYGGLFPGNGGSPTLCFSVTMTIQGYPSSVDVILNADQTVYSSCTKTLIFPPPPVCGITTVVNGTQTACNLGDNSYTQQLTLTYSNPPGTGTIDVNGQSFPITGSPQSVTLTDLDSDANPVDVSATFSDLGTCNFFQVSQFTAPAACGCGANAGTISN